MKDHHAKLSAAICMLLDKAKEDMLETLREEQTDAGEPAFGPEFYEALKDGCQIVMDVTFWEKDASPPFVKFRGQIGDGVTGTMAVEPDAFTLE